MWAVVPVKRFDDAKQRLRTALNADQRATLARAMLEDVLDALARVPELAGVLVVTREPHVDALAQRYGCRVLREDDASDGLCGALEQAARHLTAQRVEGMLIVPGDVPLLDPARLSDLVRTHLAAIAPARSAVTIVPDRNGDGTNCLIVSPPGAIAFRYGVGSARAHADAARAEGIEPRVHDLPELALDIDSADDLREFERRAGAAHTRKVLQDSRVPDAPPAQVVRAHGDGASDSGSSRGSG